MSDAAYAGLLNGGWRDLSYEYFRDGVLVHWVVKGGEGKPTVAVLKYEPGASVPLHRHAGLETIMVLDGAQSDEHGKYATGALVLNAAETEHSVWSEDGCVVLIQWDLPVIIRSEGK